MKKRLLCLIVFVICLSFSLILSFTVTADNTYFYTERIATGDTAKQRAILELVKNKEGNEKYDKMFFLFYISDYAAAYRKTFPHLSSNSSVSAVVDNGISYALDKSARGCMAYSYFVNKYVFSEKFKSYNYIDSTAGNIKADDVKNFITLYAQCGEQIRIADTHSISFVVHDNDGFYYLSYSCAIEA